MRQKWNWNAKDQRHHVWANETTALKIGLENIIHCAQHTLPWKSTHLEIPKLAGNAEILATTHHRVGLCTLARLAVKLLATVVERVLADHLRDKLAVREHGVLAGDELRSVTVGLKRDKEQGRSKRKISVNKSRKCSPGMTFLAGFLP